jgi:GNAT superfamily N-acetyltransferase
MSDPYSIARAELRHLEAIPAIELGAARLLRGHAPRSVLEETTPLGELADAMTRGLLWVALENDAPVGFAHVDMLASDRPHLEEIDVHPNHGRRGLGTRLVRTVCQWATAAGYEHLTLTTFRAVPWNMPWYARLGFVELPMTAWRDELRQRVEAETARGLDPAARVAMSYRCLRVRDVVLCEDDAACQELNTFLEERIYEFNANATGYHDARLLAGRICDEAGTVVAGFSGYTWGGCCELANVWVDQRRRGQGLGTRLLRRAEDEARARGCRRIVLATHTFQAPGFYERMGYQRKYAIEGRPHGFEDVIYVKVLDDQGVSSYCS